MTISDKMSEPMAELEEACVKVAIAAGFGKHYGDELFDTITERLTDQFNFEGIDPFEEEAEEE